jgi:hypothetical protein
MTNAVTGFKLVLSFALLSAGPAFTQTATPESTPEATTTAPVAHIYVQTTKGINVYDATATGKLTLVEGSSFADTGQMEGSNGSYLISVGTDYLHTYKIESDGGVGKQVSEINTQSYSGSECGDTAGLDSFLDHSGKYFYVQLSGIFYGGSVTCVAWQSYKVESNGALKFLGSVHYNGSAGHDATSTTGPTVSSNDKFAYGVFAEFAGYSDTSFSTLARPADGALDVNWNFTDKGPATDPNTPGGPWFFFPMLVQADPASHLAVALLNTSFSSCCDVYGSLQLASYTINDTTGSISSSNIWEDMPTSAIVNISNMKMSASGKLLAVAGAPGLQIFHFNGAAPITSYSALLLPTVNIDQLAWDNTNHLYALSYSTGELYVYTVTPTSISEAPGSPYKVANAYGLNGLVVVPKL